MKRQRDRPYPLSALAAPMAVWAVHFVVVYSLVGLACERALLLRRVAMLPVLTWLLALLTITALGMITVLGWSALHRWRRLQASASAGTPDPSHSHEAFMRLATALLALLALIAVVFTATPVFLLPPCA